MSDIGYLNTTDILPKSQGVSNIGHLQEKKHKNGKSMMIKQNNQTLTFRCDEK